MWSHQSKSTLKVRTVHPQDLCLKTTTTGWHTHQVKERMGQFLLPRPLCSEARSAHIKTNSGSTSSGSLSFYPPESECALFNMLSAYLFLVVLRSLQGSYIKSYCSCQWGAWENSLGFSAWPLPWTLALPNFYRKALYLNPPPLLNASRSATWSVASSGIFYVNILI